MSMNDRLVALRKFGKTRISSFDDGSWYAQVDVHVTTLGASLEIKSDYDCKTPEQALTQLEDRVRLATSLDTNGKIEKKE